jgi:lipopolysaccharide export system permease protein
MKRVDRLILGELIGPWAFGVAIFTVLIMAGTYLFRITDYIVQGIPPSTLLELTALLLPGVLAKTFPMAALLATLLAFGRLSSDSEVVALKACGTSLTRMMVPVAGFGLATALLAFSFNEAVVPRAALRAAGITADIGKLLETGARRPVFQPIYEAGKLVAILTARDFSLNSRTLRGAHIVTYDDQERATLFLVANELYFENDSDWRIRGGGSITSRDGSTYIELRGDAWPAEIPRLKVTPKDIFAGIVKDLDSFSMSQIRDQIALARQNPKFDRGQIANLEFGYWNKIAVPLAALVFALVGAPLGVRNHRTGAAAGFWLSVVIIFGYMLIANLMAVYVQGGALPAYVASFTPIAIGLMVSVIAIYRKNL